MSANDKKFTLSGADGSVKIKSIKNLGFNRNLAPVGLGGVKVSSSFSLKPASQGAANAAKQQARTAGKVIQPKFGIANRIVALDTETTGLSAETGDRIVEIGLVEIINMVVTGETYHVYINPEGKRVDPEAYRVHGISDDFLKNKPVFADIVDDFLGFIGDAVVVIHNANFDMGFLNDHFDKLDIPRLSNTIIDSLAFARKNYPGQRASLDALCKRFGVDNSGRNLHGALIDADLLARVWIEMNGGRAPKLDLTSESVSADSNASNLVRFEGFPDRGSISGSAEEMSRHAEFVSNFKTSLW